MKTTKETHYIDHYHDLDNLIARLTEIRSSIPEENESSVVIRTSFGNSMISVEEFRPMTELELARELEYTRRGEETAKELRRIQYLRLQAEFESETTEQKEAA